MDARGVLIVAVACIAGCSAGDGVDAPTYHQDIAPILSVRCGSCHAEGGLNPNLVFDDPEIAQGFSDLIWVQIDNGVMPPFKAVESAECPNPWGFANDPRLSDHELTLVAAWAEAGGPIGDPDTAAEVPIPPSTDLPGADLTLMPASPFTTLAKDDVQDQFVCMTLDPELTEPQWLQGVQLVPGNREVLHHVLIALDPTGATAGLGGEDGSYDCFGGFGVPAVFLGGWVPGASAIELPDLSAMRVPAGARMLMQMHYHLLDEPQQDQSGLQLRWAAETPVREASFRLLGNAGTEQAGLLPGPGDPDGVPQFLIPAGAGNHTETMRFTAFDGLPRSVEVFLAANHMHYIGRDMRMWLERSGDGSYAQVDDACIVHTPDWDFDWQQFYHFDLSDGGGPIIDPGDTMWLECAFDNTLDNPWVVAALDEAGLDEPVDVTLGEGSLDEMCIALLGTVPIVQTSAPEATHPGHMALELSSTAYAFEAPCQGPAGFAVSGEVATGSGACGLEVGGALFTLEVQFDGVVDGAGAIQGTASLQPLGFGEAIEGVWSGTVSGSTMTTTVDLSGMIAGGDLAATGSASGP